MAPRVQATNLWQAYHAKNRWGRRVGEVRWALRDVSISAGAGEIVGLIGRNGSGKTTLLQSVAGVLNPTKGSVEVDGKVASLVDLTAGVHRFLTGHENVLIGGVLLGLTRAEVRDQYEKIVGFAELSDEMLESPLFTYSAGMSLRLGFALVVHTDPAVLLVDEVLAVGDEAFQHKCVSKIEELRGAGCTVVMVSHDLTLIEERCDRTALLDEGELKFLGDPRHAVHRYRELTGGRPETPDLSDQALYGLSHRGRRRRLRR
jgi:ABC-type polysaccharide/polyol phosphate transport system ATPase subunit